jgi:hypothetical protein
MQGSQRNIQILRDLVRFAELMISFFQSKPAKESALSTGESDQS